MKRTLPLLLLAAVVVVFSTTGFQCGSAELTSAKLYMQQKQWEKAEQSLVKEISKNDKNEEAWFLLGQTRLELKNFDGMNEAYSKALTLSDVHKAEIDRNRLAIWGQLYNEGVGLYNRGKEDPANYDSAIRKFETAIVLQPDSSGTYYVAALAHYAKNDNDAAAKKLQTALQKNPGFGDAAKFLGQLHYLKATELVKTDSVAARKQYAEAARSFDTAYQADPADTENITSLIDAYERASMSDKAMALTKNAVDREPNNKVFRYAYGVFLLKQDNFQGSIEQFQKAVDIDPDYGDAVYNLGVAYLNWGVTLKNEEDKRTEEAAKKGRSVKLDKSYQDRFRAAVPYLEKVAEQRTDDALLWQQLARVYANLNMVEKSKAAFEKFDLIMKGK
jgi:tetratricopeptide (TPR) repeat protein